MVTAQNQIQPTVDNVPMTETTAAVQPAARHMMVPLAVEDSSKDSERHEQQVEGDDVARLRGGGCCGCFWTVVCAPFVALAACLTGCCCCAC